MNDEEEIARLRARVAELEASPVKAPAAQEPSARGGRARAWAAAVLIVTACLLAPLSVVSVWASTVVSDTGRYVETVAPVAEDPGVQAAVANEVTAAIMESLDIQGLTTEVMDTLAAQENMPPRVADALPALAAPLARGIEDFTRTQATALVASDRFQTVWADLNRVAHTAVTQLLEGNQGGAISAQDDQITLNLGPVIAEVKARLIDQGFALAERIPTIDKTFVLVESGGITKAQRFYSVLNTLGVWLPLIALALLAGGVLLARDRRRALLRGSLGVTAAMVLLGVTITLVRTLYVETTPADLLTSESAGNVFEILVRFLRSALRAVAVLALLVALAAFVTGPSTAARRTRSAVDRTVRSARGGADAAGWHLGPVDRWVSAHVRALRIAIFVLAGLTLVLWSQPTAWVVLWVALVVVVALAVVAFFGRSPGTAPVVSGPTMPPGPGPSETHEAGDRDSAGGAGGADGAKVTRTG